jgi:hypothetical protein
MKRGLFLVLVAGLLTAGCDTTGSGDTSDTQTDLDQRTCEIARDIAGSYNVTDTFERSQERIADLYSGYGEAASPRISSALRDWSAGMTSRDIPRATKGIAALDKACKAEGF